MSRKVVLLIAVIQDGHAVNETAYDGHISVGPHAKEATLRVFLSEGMEEVQLFICRSSPPTSNTSSPWDLFVPPGAVVTFKNEREPNWRSTSGNPGYWCGLHFEDVGIIKLPGGAEISFRHQLNP